MSGPSPAPSAPATPTGSSSRPKRGNDAAGPPSGVRLAAPGPSVVVAALGRRAAVLAFAAHMIVGSALAAEPRRVGDARLEPVAFEELSGWPEDDHAAAFAAFRRTCEALASGRPSLRPGAALAPDLAAICREASK